jgi:hypothetical protein
MLLYQHQWMPVAYGTQRRGDFAPFLRYARAHPSNKPESQRRAA